MTIARLPQLLLAAGLALSNASLHAGTQAASFKVSITGYVHPVLPHCNISISGPGFSPRSFTLPDCGPSGDELPYEIITPTMLTNQHGQAAPFLRYYYLDDAGIRQHTLLPILRSAPAHSTRTHEYTIAIPEGVARYADTLALAAGQSLTLRLD